MPRYEVYEPSGRLVVARSKISAFGDVLWLVIALLLGMRALAWVLSVFGAALFDRRFLLVLFMVLCGIGAVVYGLLSLMRAYRGYRHREILVLDRANDAVTRTGERVCALSELDRVELQRHVYDSDGWTTIFRVGLRVTGVRGRGAPRSASSALEDVIAVGESMNEREMRVCAGRIAGYAGVTIEEKET